MAFALQSATAKAAAIRPTAASRRSAVVVKATKYDEELIATAVSGPEAGPGGLGL